MPFVEDTQVIHVSFIALCVEIPFGVRSTAVFSVIKENADMSLTFQEFTIKVSLCFVRRTELIIRFHNLK